MECQLVSHGVYLGDGWPEETEQIRALRQDAPEWRLLLQLDTDYTPQMVWGIEGRCYFWIEAEKIRNRDFEHTWFIMQWT